MQKKHQEFFRKLRELCKEYGVWIGITNNKVGFSVDVKQNPVSFTPGRYAFTESTETLLDPDGVHHSISSEAKDEGEA